MGRPEGVAWSMSQFCARLRRANGHSRNMTEEDRVQRAIAEHVLWCREKRDALTDELAQYRDGTFSIGERKVGEPITQGTITHINYLRRTIDQLGRVITAYSPRGE